MMININNFTLTYQLLLKVEKIETAIHLT